MLEVVQVPHPGSGAQPSNGAAAKGLQSAGRLQRSLPSLPISAPQRVQSAMAAAQEYRQRRAAASNAESAAATAAAPAGSTANGKSKVHKGPRTCILRNFKLRTRHGT